jgi:uncharacterized protein YdeI (YjbR/CyaY-like superfamily)
MAAAPDLPRKSFASRAAWEKWLEANHASSPGVWVVFAKKGADGPGSKTISRADTLEVALCYGWIDSQAKSIDDAFWQQRFTPRRARSKWSQINCAAAEQLIASGLMRPAGLAEVERAKLDGRWERAYASPRKIEVPEDLKARLDRYPKARRAFEELDAQNRYAILFRIHDAKRADTRARRIERFVQMLREGKTIY